MKKNDISKKLEDYFKKIPFKINRVAVISLTIFILALVAIFLSIVFFVNSKDSSLETQNVNFIYTETNINDVANDTRFWDSIRIKGDQVVTFTGTFSEEINSNLLIYFQNLNVSIYVNNHLVGTTDNLAQTLSNSPGIGWLTIEAVDISTTDVVLIEMSSPYSGAYVDQYLQTINNIYSGNVLSLMRHKLTDNILVYITYIFSMITGVFCILVSFLFYISKQKRGLHFLLYGFTLLLCGVWTAPSQYFSLFINNPVFYSTLYTLSLPLIIILINTSLLISYKKPTILLYIYTFVFSIVLAIVIILQLVGVKDIYQFTLIGGIGCIIDVVFVSIALSKNYETFDEKQRKYILIKYSPIIVSLVIDVIIFVFTGKYQTTFLRFGVLLFSVVSIVELFVKFSEANELRLISMELALDVQQKENELLMHQIQPHFLFNSLNCISTLCRVDPEKAEKAVIYFSNYLRNNMELINSTGNTTFEKEINHIDQYLMLHEIRFEDDIILDVNNPCGDFEIPPLSLEPIVENAINYAFRGYKIKLKVINIDVKETIGGHIIKVSNNGKGFNVERIGNDGKKHIGMENVKNRIEKLFGGSVDIYSVPNKGTTVTIYLPTMTTEKSE